MFQHPIVAIQSGAINFSLKTKPINLKLLPSEFETVKKNVENAVEKFTNYTNATMKEFNLQSDADILKYQSEGKRDILIAALATDFLQKYASDLHYEDTYGKLLQFITDVFGSQSAAAKSKAAEEKMSTITRDSSTDEKFSRFLTRLERLAKIVTDEPKIQSFLVDRHFQKSLSPKIRNFLKEQKKTSSSSEDIAKFLDDMDKHKQSIDIHSLETNQTRDEIHALSDKFDRLQAEMREILKFNLSQQSADAVEVNAISNKKTNKPNQKPFMSQNGHRPMRSNWEYDRWGKPVQCKKCGLRGHRTEMCRGCRLECRNCHEIGHISPVCPKNERNTSKN